MIAALLIALATVSAVPPTPYFDWGACPFECCQYGKWTAVVDSSVYSSRSIESRVVVTLRKGETVNASTGVVITRKPGRLVLDQPLDLRGPKNQRVIAPKGDTVYPLHYIGEGYYLFWYRGKTYQSDIEVPAASRPDAEWWIKVRTANGTEGWINGNRGFDGADACGG